MRRAAPISVACATAAVAVPAAGLAADCRCTDPAAACWPTRTEWAGLNASVGGRLLTSFAYGPFASCRGG
eukprot:gene7013-24398_t